MEQIVMTSNRSCQGLRPSRPMERGVVYHVVYEEVRDSYDHAMGGEVADVPTSIGRRNHQHGHVRTQFDLGQDTLSHQRAPG